MWYAVFSRSIICMLFASFTMLGYLSLQLQDSYFSGPFFFCLPLPFVLLYFWHYCEEKFKQPSEVSIIGALLFCWLIRGCVERVCDS